MNKTLAEHRAAINGSGLMYGITNDEDMKKICDAMGVEYAKPKSMAEEWASRIFDNAGCDGYARMIFYRGGGQTLGPPRLEADQWIEIIQSWLSGFEVVVRSDEHKSVETERQRITRHVGILRDTTENPDAQAILSQIQRRIDEGK
jgi:hypothetical protein